MSFTVLKYNNIQVILHWITALLVIFMLVMGEFVLSKIPNSSLEKPDALKGHMIIGGSLLILTLIRIIWRRMSAQPAHADTGNKLLDKLAVAAHFALNILTLLVAISGIGIAIQAGLPDIVFGGQGVLPETFHDLLPRKAHGLLTKLLMFLVVIHVVGALYHQFIVKDNLFKRMWFGKSGR